MAGENPLAEELATFEARRSGLLGTDAGRFALVHGQTVLGAYDTQRDAAQVGYERLGNVPFLTRQIVEVDAPATFTRDFSVIPQGSGTSTGT